MKGAHEERDNDLLVLMRLVLMRLLFFEGKVHRN